MFVNDVLANTSTQHVPVPDPPSGLYLDMWSANSTWTGSMPLSGSAVFEIQWIELLFNTTVPPSSTSNPKICSVGEVANITVPVGKNSASSRREVDLSGMAAVVALAGVAVASLVL